MKNNNNEDMFLDGMCGIMVALMGLMVIALFPSWLTTIIVMVAICVGGKKFEDHYGIDLNDLFEEEL